MKASLATDLFPKVVFFELKFANENEFSHWSTTEFKKLGRKRKTREWETLEMIKKTHCFGILEEVKRTSHLWE